MLAGLLLLELLSLVLIALVLVIQQVGEVRMRAEQRLSYEVRSLALQSREALLEERPGWVGLSVKMMGEAPTVARAMVTDPAGNMLFVSNDDADQVTLTALERAEIPRVAHDQAQVFTDSQGNWESVEAIYTGSDLRGYAWVKFDKGWSQQQRHYMLGATAIFGVIWMVASAILVLLMAGTITRPLATLHRGTRALMNSPESGGKFPLPVAIHNEIGDLIEAFNRMVASIEEQRAGLNDTLSLLDSMLANAPIGLAFVDSECRFVRVNQVFADMTGSPLNRHLGRTLQELLPKQVARSLEATVQRVFAQEAPVRNLEINGTSGKTTQPWTWLVSAYPVRTTPQQVRWAGVIVLDATDRKRAEEALRRTEKLAATGRLAASIAHEINNPLEAITNLLFLLDSFCSLEEPARNYVTMAQHEARRISEITQQTLRFYRQSTLPARASMSELLDSVLSLYHGRLNGLNVQVTREYDPELDLFCFAGEMRQVFANLIGNSLDALSADGRLTIRARRGHSWRDPAQTGVRFSIADNGSGMEPQVLARAFDAFFTTKEVTGTGLGLWVSQEILVKHHAVVAVRSRAASHKLTGPETMTGTVFHIFVPDDPALMAAAAPAAATSSAAD
jgi:PAS domain S-box-containing protein